MSDEKKKDDSWLLPLALGLAGVGGGIALGLYVIPEVLKLLTPKYTLVPEVKVAPKPALPEVAPAPEPFSRNLRPKFFFSGTTSDEQSLSQKAENTALLARADASRYRAVEEVKRQQGPAKLKARYM